jgi:hypothetical protein
MKIKQNTKKTVILPKTLQNKKEKHGSMAYRRLCMFCLDNWSALVKRFLLLYVKADNGSMTLEWCLLNRIGRLLYVRCVFICVA